MTSGGYSPCREASDIPANIVGIAKCVAFAVAYALVKVVDVCWKSCKVRQQRSYDAVTIGDHRVREFIRDQEQDRWAFSAVVEFNRGGTRAARSLTDPTQCKTGERKQGDGTRDHDDRFAGFLLVETAVRRPQRLLSR